MKNDLIEEIESIDNQLDVIRKEYVGALFPKRYIGDMRYIKLRAELQRLKTSLAKQNKPKPKSNKQENFEKLSSKLQQKLTKDNYNIELDQDEILSFYENPCPSDLALESKAERINDMKLKNNL